MTSLRDLAPAAGVFVVALAYLMLLRPYGFQLEDEGTLLFWFDRAMRGEQPYVDFHTGYTPGFFALGKAVFSVFGTSATALRTVLAVINALSAAGMAELTRRVAGRWLAPLPPLLWLAFMPVYVGEFAAFNVPYPTWAVTLAFVVLAFALLAWMESRRALLLVAAGAAAAIAMWLRPNSGAFAIAAATWIVVAGSSRRRPLDQIAAISAASFMALGVWYTFTFRVSGVDAMVHLLPGLAMVVLLAGALARRIAIAGIPAASDSPAADTADLPRGEDAPGEAPGLTRGGSNSPGAVISLTWLGGAFLAGTAAWTLPLLAALGFERFAAEVFLVGADVQTIYYNSQPPPEPYALLVVLAMVAVAAGGRAVASGRVRPLPVLAAVAVAGAAVKLVVFRQGIAPEGVLHSIVAQLENAAFWLAAVASFGAVAWLYHVSAEALRTLPRARAMVVLTPIAAAMYMQVFPRNDFMHQITAVPLTAVVACGLLDRVASWWSRGNWPEGWHGARLVRFGVLVAGFSMVVLGFADKAGGPLASVASAAPATPMPSRLDVRVEAAAGDELEAIASSVAFLQARTSGGETLWAFPATSGILFASGSVNVAPHDYWYPGRPDREEEQRVLAMLRESRPRFIVTLNKGWNFFADAPAYFTAIRTHVAGEYTLAARFGRYDILGRRDVVEGDVSLPVRPLLRAGTTTGLDALLEPNLERRRQAAWRWMDAMTPEEASAATLPADRRDALLLLRGLRDGGDMRGAAWAILGYQSADSRIRGEAVDAMLALERALRSEKARFANDYDPARYRPYVASWADDATALRGIRPLEAFADAVLELSQPNDGEPVRQVSQSCETRTCPRFVRRCG